MVRREARTESGEEPRLEQVNDECPRCGCQSFAEVKQRTRGASCVVSIRVCLHCGTRRRTKLQRLDVQTRPVDVESRLPEIQTREYQTLVAAYVKRRRSGKRAASPPCPECGGRTKVASSPAKYRWHACVEGNGCPNFKTPK